MTCRTQAKPPEPYVSPYILRALERIRKMDEDDKCREKQREERPTP